MTPSRDLAAQHAWRGAITAAILNAAGMSADFIVARNIPGMPIYPYAISVSVGIGLIAFLLIRRERATIRVSSAIFLINMAAIHVALWISSGYWATSGRPWTPFQASKLGMLAVPMLAPQLGVGLVAIAGFAVLAIGKYFVFDPDIQRGFPVGEPWLILIYALFAGVLLVYRVRALAIERAMLRAQAEAAANGQLARTFVRLSDYANTPIQTITFATALLRANNHDDVQPIVDRLERALERLKQVSEALSRYQRAHPWSPGAESLDVAMTGEQLSRNEPWKLSA